MADKAGIFGSGFNDRFQEFTSASPEPFSLSWQDKRLCDAAGHEFALARVGVISIGPQHFLVEDLGSLTKFVMRATGSNGEAYTVSQQSVSVSRLIATVPGNRYVLERLNPFRRERHVHTSTGALVMRVRPRLDGRVDVDNRDATADIPLVDVAILSWACVLVDGPGRTQRAKA